MREDVVQMARVLVVEDVLEVQDLVDRRLRRSGHDVVCSTADPEVVLERHAAFAPDVCVIDVALPDEAGLRALRAIHGTGDAVRLIACTRAGEDLNVISAIRSGASEVVSTLHALELALARPAVRRRDAPRRALSA